MLVMLKFNWAGDHHLPVVPAKAGIHAVPYRCGTVGETFHPLLASGVMDPGVGRDDE
jgi:hypothetical protein